MIKFYNLTLGVRFVYSRLQEEEAFALFSQILYDATISKFTVHVSVVHTIILKIVNTLILQIFEINCNFYVF